MNLTAHIQLVPMHPLPCISLWHGASLNIGTTSLFFQIYVLSVKLLIWLVLSSSHSHYNKIVKLVINFFATVMMILEYSEEYFSDTTGKQCRHHSLLKRRFHNFYTTISELSSGEFFAVHMLPLPRLLLWSLSTSFICLLKAHAPSRGKKLNSKVY